MSKSKISAITTDEAPKAIGAYSQAICAGGFVFVSGQIALNPVSVDVVSGGIKEQTTQVLKNIEAILREAGLSLENAVRVDVYLKDLKDFPAMNEVYATFFPWDMKPARVALEVSRLPRDVLIEIACIACMQ